MTHSADNLQRLNDSVKRLATSLPNHIAAITDVVKEYQKTPTKICIFAKHSSWNANHSKDMKRAHIYNWIGADKVAKSVVFWCEIHGIYRLG
jgi:hypothetical protein